MPILDRKSIPVLAAMAMALPAHQALATEFITPTTVIDNVIIQDTDWTGFYAGVIAGWGVSQNDAKTTGNSAFLEENPLFFPRSLNLNQNGGTLGLSAGFNRQINGFILGMEADAAYLGFDRTSSYASPPTLFTDDYITTATHKMDFFSTVRGRVGVPISDRGMLFATVGLAVGHVDYTTSIIGMAPLTTQLAWNGRQNGFKLGWTAGVGGEYMLTEKVSFKLEGLYYVLADSKASAIGNEAVQQDSSLNQTVYESTRKNNGVIARAGLNYRF